jgi:hypothetical protein
MTTYPPKIGELRASGVRNVLIYCRDHRCSHHVEISAVRLSDIEPDFVCTPAANVARTCGCYGVMPGANNSGAAS